MTFQDFVKHYYQSIFFLAQKILESFTASISYCKPFVKVTVPVQLFCLVAKKKAVTYFYRKHYI